MATISSNLQMTLPESFDKVDVDILSDNFQKIDDFAGEAITKEKVANNLTTTEEGKALDARQGKILSDEVTKRATTAFYKGTLAKSGWSGAPPYSQTVSISGINTGDIPIVDIDMSDITQPDNGIERAENWGRIGRIVSGDNQITAYCYIQKPETDLPVILKVVR